MLRPYAAALCFRQLGPRQGLRRLHVRLVECVDSQTGAQLLRGVLPRHELRAQREGIGGELAHDLTLGPWRREWVINDGDDAAPPLPVLSATSCSIQSASRATRRGGRSTSLSRPASTPSAIRLPRTRAASASTASARSSRTRPFTPSSAAGSMPTTVRGA